MGSTIILTCEYIISTSAPSEGWTGPGSASRGREGRRYVGSTIILTCEYIISTAAPSEGWTGPGSASRGREGRRYVGSTIILTCEYIISTAAPSEGWTGPGSASEGRIEDSLSLSLYSTGMCLCVSYFSRCQRGKRCTNNMKYTWPTPEDPTPPIFH